jgi:hypothetical protein
MAHTTALETADAAKWVRRRENCSTQPRATISTSISTGPCVSSVTESAAWRLGAPPPLETPKTGGGKFWISELLPGTDSVRFHERMELIKAVENQDVEKVKVRRPLEAVSSTESGPSRAVCRGSVGGPSMPSSHARLGLAGSNPALTSGTTQALLMLHAGARPCRSGRQVP